MSAAARALRYLEVVLAAARLQITGMRGSPFPILLGVVQPAAYLVITMHGRALTPEAATTDMLGTAMMTLWGSTIWSAGGILRRERAQGTMPQLIRSWCDARVVLFGKCLGAVAVSGTAISVTTTVMMLALGTPVHVDRPLLFVALAVLAALSTVGLAMLLGSLFILTRAAVRISEALMYPVVLAGGLLIPLTLMPSWLRWPSWFISLHWAQVLTSECALGRSVQPGQVAALAALGVLYAAAGVAVFGRAVDLGRRRGTLEFF
ncbi:ABC transporter permease [Kitasatospora sp. GP82]|uniref:ABC transporter permease n=1 Tax=Kitasatospora sp. GP82 TaxID=3035089 RepID=UPI0024730CBF|nr:ABC transporter permease [Kitasatospora sp. GP82]MDH6128393.1 ABC-2 type transport system permease protein [Kitasatospora sp. GP82]